MYCKWPICFRFFLYKFRPKFLVEFKICDKILVSARPKPEFINWSLVSALPKPNFGQKIRFHLLFIYSMHSKCKICPYAQKENLLIDIGYNSSESGVLPDSVLFEGTVSSNSVLFGGAVLPYCLLFGGTVPPRMITIIHLSPGST